ESVELAPFGVDGEGSEPGDAGKKEEREHPRDGDPQRPFARRPDNPRPQTAPSLTPRRTTSRTPRAPGSPRGFFSVSLASVRRAGTSDLLLGFLVFFFQDVHDLAQAAVAVEEFDLLEPVEHVFGIEAVTRGGPLFFDDQSHHRVVVNGLP